MSDDQVGTPLRLPVTRKSWWRRRLCRHPQRSTWQEDGRWHTRCLDFLWRGMVRPGLASLGNRAAA